MTNDLSTRNSEREEMESLLKGDDVAKILNISRPYAFRLIRQGRIPAIRLGRSVRVRRMDLEAFITANVGAQV
jgi:excisionase family DNA binding protein